MPTEVLTPIDEEPDDEDDKPITMVPKIIQTAPSPSVEYQPIVANQKQNNNNNDHKVNGSANDSKPKEISQMESVL